MAGPDIESLKNVLLAQGQPQQQPSQVSSVLDNDLQFLPADSDTMRAWKIQKRREMANQPQAMPQPAAQPQMFRPTMPTPGPSQIPNATMLPEAIQLQILAEEQRKRQ